MYYTVDNRQKKWFYILVYWSYALIFITVTFTCWFLSCSISLLWQLYVVIHVHLDIYIMTVFNSLFPYKTRIFPLLMYNILLHTVDTGRWLLNPPILQLRTKSPDFYISSRDLWQMWFRCCDNYIMYSNICISVIIKWRNNDCRWLACQMHFYMTFTST